MDGSKQEINSSMAAEPEKQNVAEIDEELETALDAKELEEYKYAALFPVNSGLMSMFLECILYVDTLGGWRSKSLQPERNPSPNEISIIFAAQQVKESIQLFWGILKDISPDFFDTALQNFHQASSIQETEEFVKNFEENEEYWKVRVEAWVYENILPEAKSRSDQSCRENIFTLSLYE